MVGEFSLTEMLQPQNNQSRLINRWEKKKKENEGREKWGGVGLLFIVPISKIKSVEHMW